MSRGDTAEAMKLEKNRSIMEEIKSLWDLEAYTGSLASSNRKIDLDHLTKQINNIASAIGAHKKKSETYIRYLEEKVSTLERRLRE
jgi:myosin-crossreactive antigen